MPTTYEAPTLGEVAITATKAGEVVANKGTSEFGTASTSIATGDLALVTVLPAMHVPVDLVGHIGDADSGTTFTFDVGFVGNDDGDDDDQDAFGAGYTTGQAGGVFRATAVGFLDIEPVDHDRIVGIKATATGATPSTVPDVSISLQARRAMTGRD